MTWVGISQSRVFRGLVLSSEAIALSCLSVFLQAPAFFGDVLS